MTDTPTTEPENGENFGDEGAGKADDDETETEAESEAESEGGDAG